MKLSAIGIVVAALAHGITASEIEGGRGLKGAMRRLEEVEEEDSGVMDDDIAMMMGNQTDDDFMGGNVTDDEVEADTDTDVDEDVDSMPAGNETSEYELDPDGLWYEAESLDYFKKEIDPEDFEWVNPDEIAPGATTCGFLKPDLGSLDDVKYPKIRVYVCVRFANTQPASKGNLFVHCGGPGSLSGCINIMGDSFVLGEQNLNDYNILSIDQRGMGRSEPNFIREECSDNSFVRDDTGAIVEVVPPAETLTYAGLGGADESIKDWLGMKKRTVESCWTCTTCGFNLEAEQEDGSIRKFHFLQYSGTRQVAEDIWRITGLFNAPRMHVYGISYGTGVFSAFATAFPSLTGLFILDSCISANPDHYHNARTRAIGENERIDYVIYSCSARNLFEPGSCPVEDMRKCVGDVSDLLAGYTGQVPGGNGPLISSVVLLMITDPTVAGPICGAAADAAGSADPLVDVLKPLLPDFFGGGSTRQASDPSSQPTDESNVVGNPDYQTIAGLTPILMVRAQDRAGPIYDEDRFAEETAEIANRYNGAGTGQPGIMFAIEYSFGYYWPKAVPVPPAGSAFLPGIIIGILYDSNTPYTWTQEMKAAFPHTSLITNQGTKHGVGTQDPACQRHVVNYLETGYVNFVDGQVCGAEFASVVDTGAAFGLALVEVPTEKTP